MNDFPIAVEGTHLVTWFFFFRLGTWEKMHIKGEAKLLGGYCIFQTVRFNQEIKY